MSRSSLDILREIALALPEAAESSHFDTPDFRVRGKIFATGRANGPLAVLKLPRELAEAMIEAHPDGFRATPSWGRFGWTFVETDKIDAGLFRDLTDTAWGQVAPKKLVAARNAKDQ